MVSAPLVMPEVVLGISLLLMFVEISQVFGWPDGNGIFRSEEHTSELQSLMRISYAVFCLKKTSQPSIQIPRSTHTTHYYQRNTIILKLNILCCHCILMLH